MKPQRLSEQEQADMFDLAEKSDLPEEVETVEDLFDFMDEEDDSEVEYEVSDAELKAWFDDLPVALLEDMIEGKGMSPDPRAARLRKYWSVGEGGVAKIRWGEPGDGKRCISHLRKYLGVRAPGYCQNLHRVMVAGRVMGKGPGEKEEMYWETLEYKKKFSTERREELAKEGEALPDGSYPIENEQDLKNAIQAFGRAKDKARAKAHIIKRAKALGLERLIPEGWTSEKSASVTERIARLKNTETKAAEPEEEEDPPVLLSMKDIQDALDGYETKD